MKREALIRSLRKEAKAMGVDFGVIPGRGKGSHYVIRFGERETLIKSGELTPVYVKVIRKQLGLD